MKRPSIDDTIKAYEENGCNVTATCEALGISRKVFREMVSKSRKLSEAIEEFEESMKDFAESKLRENIENNDVESLMFYLRTKGRSRGYVEGSEVVVNIGNNASRDTEAGDPTPEQDR